MTQTAHPTDKPTAVATIEEGSIADQVLHRVTTMEAANELTLPDGYHVGNALKSAWLYLQSIKDKADRPATQTCTRASIANCLLEMVIRGEHPMHHCYFIPTGNQLTFWEKYTGKLMRAKRDTDIQAVNAQVVYKGDEFTYTVDEDGRYQLVAHKTSIQNMTPANIVAAYAVVIMRDGVVVKDTPASETNVSEITRCMVGRSVDLSSAKREIVDHSGAKNILSIRNLWVDMPGETVRNVTLDVKEGEILGIGGLAGQGKLGIPNGVMGLYEAGGTVEFDGKEIPLNSPRKCLDASLAFVSEDRRGVGLLLDETLEWNVAFPAMQIQNKFLKKIGPVTWRDEKAIHDITQKYIGELMIKCTSSLQKARELSGGNQQKICLAKAFALEPRFLFVSEPTRGIDVGAKALVLDALRRFNRESGVTVVMISSELEELRQTCDRIAIVSGGRIAGILPATDSSEAFGALMVSQVK